MKVCLDSRTIKPGEYFVPVKGENSDGHDYIESAKSNGAVGVIEVEELYKLASEKLSKIHPKVIAITGSVGKTTTREYIVTLLSSQFVVCNGNLNTKLGLATSIVNEMQDNCQFFVAECGMDRKGELAEVGAFIKPDIVVLTNISESHMEKLGTMDDIIEAKAELVQSLSPDTGVAYLNWTNPFVRLIADKYPPHKIVQYGEDFERELTENSNLIGDHNLMNLQCAYKIAKNFNVQSKNLVDALHSIKSPKGRLNHLDGINGSIIFDDTYNSSPVSCLASLKAIRDFSYNKNLNGRKIAVLGGMLELGSFEKEGHKAVGEAVLEYDVDILLLVGELAQKILLGIPQIPPTLKILSAPDIESAVKIINEEIQPRLGDVILVKASQGIRLEKVVAEILADKSIAKDVLVRQDEKWS